MDLPIIIINIEEGRLLLLRLNSLLIWEFDRHNGDRLSYSAFGLALGLYIALLIIRVLLDFFLISPSLLLLFLCRLLKRQIIVISFYDHLVIWGDDLSTCIYGLLLRDLLDYRTSIRLCRVAFFHVLMIWFIIILSKFIILHIRPELLQGLQHHSLDFVWLWSDQLFERDLNLLSFQLLLILN